ncbi:MAG: GspE/PulE family protein [Mycobacterium leprae]
MAGLLQRKPVRLGDILLQAKLITPNQLATALELQRSSGGRLGEILVNQGFVTEFDMYNTLANQLGHPFVPNPEQQFEPAAVTRVSELLAKKYRAIPLKVEGGSLLVATSDPLNFVAMDDIGMHSGMRVKPVVSPDRAVQRAITKAYGSATPNLPQAEVAAAAEPLAKRSFDLDESGDGVIKLVNNLIAQGLSIRATDLHVEPGEQQIRVRYRVDGVMREANSMPKNALNAVLSRIKVMASMDIAERRLPQDGRIEVEMSGRRLDLRVATVPTVYGEKVAIRILDRGAAIMGLADLGMEADVLKSIRSILAKPNGMLLVTGPTGSGKTTTLMSALAELNDPSRHILTIEDPVEYNLPGVNQVQVNVKAGLTFATGLRAFLRQDPDVIMVGEIRDGETADIGVRAALTGHMVLSTLHTNQAAGAPGRLIDMGVEPFLLASSLVGVISQRLVRSLCPRCREAYQVEQSDPDYHLLEEAGMIGATLYKPKGCGQCDCSGYQGRIALVELLAITPEIRELINQRATAGELEHAARQHGMRSLWQDGLRKAARGLTSLEEVKRVAFAEE